MTRRRVKGGGRKPTPLYFIDANGKTRHRSGRFASPTLARRSSVYRALEEAFRRRAAQDVSAIKCVDWFSALDFDARQPNLYPTDFVDGASLGDVYDKMSRLEDMIEPETRFAWSGAASGGRRVEVYMSFYDPERGESIKRMVRGFSVEKTVAELRDYFRPGGDWWATVESEIVPYFNTAASWRLVDIVLWRVDANTPVKSDYRFRAEVQRGRNRTPKNRV